MTYQLKGVLEASYCGVVICFGGWSKTWMAPELNLQADSFEALANAIDERLQALRRVNVDVLLKNCDKLAPHTATLIDGEAVWLKDAKGNRSKWQMRDVFFADAQSVAEYAARNELVEKAREELDAALSHLESLHVTAETLIARTNGAEANND